MLISVKMWFSFLLSLYYCSDCERTSFQISISVGVSHTALLSANHGQVGISHDAVESVCLKKRQEDRDKDERVTDGWKLAGNLSWIPETV